MGFPSEPNGAGQQLLTAGVLPGETVGLANQAQDCRPGTASPKLQAWKGRHDGTTEISRGGLNRSVT